MEFDGKIWTFSNKNDQIGNCVEDITVSKLKTFFDTEVMNELIKIDQKR